MEEKLIMVPTAIGTWCNTKRMHDMVLHFKFSGFHKTYFAKTSTVGTAYILRCYIHDSSRIGIMGGNIQSRRL